MATVNSTASVTPNSAVSATADNTAEQMCHGGPAQHGTAPRWSSPHPPHVVADGWRPGASTATALRRLWREALAASCRDASARDDRTSKASEGVGWGGLRTVRCSFSVFGNSAVLFPSRF